MYRFKKSHIPNVTIPCDTLTKGIYNINLFIFLLKIDVNIINIYYIVFIFK